MNERGMRIGLEKVGEGRRVGCCDLRGFSDA